MRINALGMAVLRGYRDGDMCTCYDTQSNRVFPRIKGAIEKAIAIHHGGSGVKAGSIPATPTTLRFARRGEISNKRKVKNPSFCVCQWLATG